MINASGTMGPMRSRNFAMCANHSGGSLPVGVQTHVKSISGCNSLSSTAIATLSLPPEIAPMCFTAAATKRYAGFCSEYARTKAGARKTMRSSEGASFFKFRHQLAIIATRLAHTTLCVPNDVQRIRIIARIDERLAEFAEH